MRLCSLWETNCVWRYFLERRLFLSCWCLSLSLASSFLCLPSSSLRVSLVVHGKRRTMFYALLLSCFYSLLKKGEYSLFIQEDSHEWLAGWVVSGVGRRLHLILRVSLTLLLLVLLVLTHSCREYLIDPQSVHQSLVVGNESLDHWEKSQTAIAFLTRSDSSFPHVSSPSSSVRILLPSERIEAIY